MPYTTRVLSRLAATLSQLLRLRYEYYDCIYHGRKPPEKSPIDISFRGRDIRVAFDEYLKSVSAEYGSLYETKLNEVMKKLETEGFRFIHEGDWIRFLNIVYEHVGKTSFDKQSFFGRIFNIVHKEYFTLVPINFDERKSKTIQQVMEEILRSLEALIPLAEALDSVAKETNCLIDFKIQATLVDYLFQEDTLVVHYQKREARAAIRKAVENILHQYNVQIIDRKLKSNSGFDIILFPGSAENNSHTNLVQATLNYYFIWYILQVFEKQHAGWATFAGTEPSPAKLAEFSETVISEELKKVFPRFFQMSPSELANEREKYDSLIDKKIAEIKAHGAATSEEEKKPQDWGQI